MTQEQIDKLQALAAKHDPNDEPDEYWDSGNFDDCFQAGVQTGENNIYFEISKILNSPTQSETSGEGT